jgi:uroporphyrinogen-III synthase
MGASVLVTRPQPGAADTAARLEGRGLRPILAPMLAVRTLAAALPAPDAIQAILVTSANALQGLSSALRDLPLLAVGAATAKLAVGLGFTNVQSADGDAVALAALTRRCCNTSGLPLLLAHGAGHGDPLAEALTAAGFALLRAAVYATEPVTSLAPAARNAWQSQDLEAALFFSAGTARVFADLAGGAELAGYASGVEAIAISARTAAALAPLPWRRVRVADRPDQEAMLALLS